MTSWIVTQHVDSTKCTSKDNALHSGSLDEPAVFPRKTNRTTHFFFVSLTEKQNKNREKAESERLKKRTGENRRVNAKRATTKLARRLTHPSVQSVCLKNALSFLFFGVFFTRRRSTRFSPASLAVHPQTPSPPKNETGSPSLSPTPLLITFLDIDPFLRGHPSY